MRSERSIDTDCVPTDIGSGMRLARTVGMDLTARRLGPERIALLLVMGLALAGCALGLLVEPGAAPHATSDQALDLVRIVCTLALVLSLLLGPGLAWRALKPTRD